MSDIQNEFVATGGGVMPPAVAGTFYPERPDRLLTEVEGHLRGRQRLIAEPKAIIAPHAGYIYSGHTAGAVHAQLGGARVRRVVLVGPSHRMRFAGLAVPSVSAFRTPLGDLPVDRDAISALLAVRGVQANDAPFRPEHCLDVQLPFLQRVLTPCAIVPILVGDADPLLVDTALEAVWGGPETRIVISSDLSHYRDYDAARAIDATTGRAIETLRADILTGQHACGHVAVNALLQRARRLDMRATTIDMRNSGDTAGPRDRVVGYGGWCFEEADAARLSNEDRALLWDTALASIRHGLSHGAALEPDMAQAPATLRTGRASFVTLTLDGQLRGCIGTLQPQRPLLADVAHNAWRAAFADPRFQGIGADIVDRLAVSISILGTPRPIPAGSEAEVLTALRPERDGLIIRAGERAATFLPKVWEHLPHGPDFLRALKAKAGLDRELWPEDVRAWRFSTEDF